MNEKTAVRIAEALERIERLLVADIVIRSEIPGQVMIDTDKFIRDERERQARRSRG